jgi:hypothetical protein
MHRAQSESVTRFALGELATRLGAELIGDPSYVVSRIASLDAADGDAISFLSNPRYLPALATSMAGCVIVSPTQRDAAARRGAALITEDPYLCFARLTQLWAAQGRGTAGAVIHPSAVVHAGAQLAQGVSVGPARRDRGRCGGRRWRGDRRAMLHRCWRLSGRSDPAVGSGGDWRTMPHWRAWHRTQRRRDWR